jgi:hypothetical protein
MTRRSSGLNATQLLLLQIKAEKLPQPELEYRFHPKRRWRWDLCWRKWKIAVEIHGGIYSRGRHVRSTGFTNDREKINAGIELGWRTFEYTPEQVESGQAIKQLVRVLA